MAEKLPQVDLFTDKSASSREAKRLLRKNNITYLEFRAGKDYSPGPDFPNPPVIGSRAGQYTGLKGVKDYIILDSIGK